MQNPLNQFEGGSHGNVCAQLFIPSMCVHTEYLVNDHKQLGFWTWGKETKENKDNEEENVTVSMRTHHLASKTTPKLTAD